MLTNRPSGYAHYSGCPWLTPFRPAGYAENLRAENADLRKQLAEALKDVERLREFAKFIFKSVWQGYDVDGGEAQDKAEALGLIVKVPADEAFKEEWDADEMFVFVWSDAAMATSLAQRTYT